MLGRVVNEYKAKYVMDANSVVKISISQQQMQEQISPRLPVASWLDLQALQCIASNREC